MFRPPVWWKRYRRRRPRVRAAAPGAVQGVGTLSLTLGLSGAGTVAVQGAGTLALSLSLTGAGTVAVQGTGTLPLSVALVGSGAVGSIPVTGTGVLPLHVGLSGIGTVAVSGSGQLGLTVALAGTGTVAIQGGGTLPLVLALSGAGTVGSVPITGSGTLPLTLTLAGTGVVGTIPVTGTGWRLTLRTAGPRWRIAWRPMPNAPFPLPVSPANDAGLVIDEIAGFEVPSGAPLTYDGASIAAHWALSADSDVPLQSVSDTFPRNSSTPRFAVAFEAAAMTTVLTGLTDGTPVWLVLTGAGNFRTAIEHIVRTRVLDQ